MKITSFSIRVDLRNWKLAFLENCECKSDCSLVVKVALFYYILYHDQKLWQILSYGGYAWESGMIMCFIFKNMEPRRHVYTNFLLLEIWN